MFKKMKVQILGKFDIDTLEIEDYLKKFQFSETQPTQEESIGWISPFESSEVLHHAGGGAILLNVMKEKKSVPASLLKRETEKEILRRKETNPDYNPSGDDKKEIKEGIKLRLLPDAQSAFTETRLYIDTKDNYIVIESDSDKMIESINSLLTMTFSDKFEFKYLVINKEPTEEMAQWLSELDLPEHVQLGCACKLKDPISKRAVALTSYDLTDDDKIVSYIDSGMEVQSLAISWSDSKCHEEDDEYESVIFTLNKALSLSSIKTKAPKADNQSDETEEQKLDADFTLFVGQMRGFIPNFFANFE
ncbi:recombination-associated protein RdgC [Pseudoalteromonas sp. OFAV1]|uniref:recombination-associated protein RdgC n=1 Tax=Pseudoalteromonas sp. OFAV1 TaxID=2908892 RepID=UPI001F2E74D8|nr:recombination-associated protein RdgC [Pseudoalteromonas sp. OFAV1]MCF2900957.1 recombination-associated protein RdgC [Pseudoalteromonas sp. OFAV1]